MNKSNNIKVVIFDFDGTIADSFEIFIEALQTVLKRQQALTAAEISDLQNSSVQEIIKKFGIKKWQLPLLVTKGRREISRRMDRVEPFAGMPEVLKELAGMNYKLYILSTNDGDNIADFLEKYDLSQYITRTYAKIGLLGKVKSLNKLQKQQGLMASECLYVGDELRDVEAAKKARIACLAVTWGFSNPDALKAHHPNKVVNRPQDLAKTIHLFEK